MRIDPTSSRSGLEVVKPASGEKPPVRSDDVSVSSDEAGVYQPTAELTRLLTAVRGMPETRPEVIQEVSERMKAGELDSPGAAADTAKAITDEPCCHGE